jgi:hypothetical protein
VSEVVLHYDHSDTQRTAPCVACRCSKHPSTAKGTLLYWLRRPIAPNRDRPTVAIVQCISSLQYPKSWDRGLPNFVTPHLNTHCPLDPNQSNCPSANMALPTLALIATFIGLYAVYKYWESCRRNRIPSGLKPLPGPKGKADGLSVDSCRWFDTRTSRVVLRNKTDVS